MSLTGISDHFIVSLLNKSVFFKKRKLLDSKAFNGGIGSNEMRLLFIRSEKSTQRSTIWSKRRWCV